MSPTTRHEDPIKLYTDAIGHQWPPPNFLSPGGHHRLHQAQAEFGIFQVLAITSEIRHNFSSHNFEKLIFSEFWCEFSHIHKRVILWVWEIIRCEKREKVPSEVLYRVQKCFPLAVHMEWYPKFWAQYLGYPSMWTAGGKTFFELCREPHKVPSRVSRT